MSVTPETAKAISTTLVRVMKVIGSMKSQLPVTKFIDVPGLDHSHFPTLFTLGHEPRRVSALAELIHSDISTVSRQVSHLVQLGLVEKIDDPADGRAQLLSLSPTGRRVIDELVDRRGEWFEQLLRGWSEDEAAAFLAHLGRFGDDVESWKADLVGAHHTSHPAPVDVAAGATTSNTSNTSNQEH